MNNIVNFEVTATPEVALKKLAKHNIPVYNLKKHGAKLCFGVNNEYIKKVFAIFKHPCYNTVIRRKSVKMRLQAFVKNRFAILIGSLAFLAVIAFSQQVVLKVKITGNAGYLSPRIMQIARECGVREFSFCKSFDKPLLSSRVLALDGVEFCSVQRQGSFIIIDVHASQNEVLQSSYSPLKASQSGVIHAITPICGTAEKSVGDAVAQGEILIGAYEMDPNGQRIDCLAVGFAEIEVEGSLTLFYDCESEKNTASALSAPSLYSDRVIDKSYTVKNCQGGVEYEVLFTYLVTDTINIE